MVWRPRSVSSVAGLIVADSTVWISYFNGTARPAVELLDRVLAAGAEQVVILPIIVTEVLQGFRSDADYEAARRVLLDLPLLAPDLAIHVDAADLFRSLRRRGTTVRGSIDCVIASTCLAVDAELLTEDGDFELIARQVPLRLRRP